MTTEPPTADTNSTHTSSYCDQGDFFTSSWGLQTFPVEMWPKMEEVSLFKRGLAPLIPVGGPAVMVHLQCVRELVDDK